jgi:hypothetical protein
LVGEFRGVREVDGCPAHPEHEISGDRDPASCPCGGISFIRGNRRRSRPEHADPLLLELRFFVPEERHAGLSRALDLLRPGGIAHCAAKTAAVDHELVDVCAVLDDQRLLLQPHAVSRPHVLAQPGNLRRQLAVDTIDLEQNRADAGADIPDFDLQVPHADRILSSTCRSRPGQQENQRRESGDHLRHLPSGDDVVVPWSLTR